MVKSGLQGLLIIILAIVLLVILIVALFPLEIFAIISAILLVYFFNKYDTEMVKSLDRDKYKAYCGETSLEPLRGIDKITTFTGVIIVAAIVIIVAIASIVNSFEVVLDSVIS